MSRELDIKVAEAMGCLEPPYISTKVAVVWQSVNVPYFSTDIAAAWQVVKWMITGKPWECYVEHQLNGWFCTFSHPGALPGKACALYAPEAICLAFLRAMDIEWSGDAA